MKIHLFDSKLRLMLTLVCLSALALALWVFWYEPSLFEVKQYQVTLQRWPKSCRGLKVAVLSDLHVGSPYYGIDKLIEVVEAANAAQPDLVLLAGDYVIHEVAGGHFVEPEPIIRELSKLHARSGVYAVLGNHDWWYSASRMRRAFADANISLLENKSVRIHQEQCEFWLAGIGDFWMGHLDFYKALHDIPIDSAIVAFTHNPDLFYEIPASIAITFAGHTHGGQVYLPFFGRLIVPSRYGEKFALGLIQEAGRTLFVTAGLGTSIIPVRFRVPPEISVVTLN